MAGSPASRFCCARCNRLYQRFAFQQGAEGADGKAVTGADGIHHVVDLDRGHCRLVAGGGFKPERRPGRF